MSVTRPPQWSSRLLCMIPIIMKVQLEVVCKTVCGWLNWHHMYHAVMSLLCAEVMSHFDLNGCIPLSAVKFQSVCYCNLLKGQGYSWVNCMRMSWSFGGLMCPPLLLSCRIITCDFKRVQQKVIFDSCFLFKMFWWKVGLMHTGQLTLATSELLLCIFLSKEMCYTVKKLQHVFHASKSLHLSQDSQLFHIILFTYLILCSDQQCFCL